MSRRPECYDALLLHQCEAVINVECDHLRKLHRALDIIESRRLYRPVYDTFEDYLATRWPQCYINTKEKS